MTNQQERLEPGMTTSFAERLRDAIMRDERKICLMRLEATGDDEGPYSLMVMDVIGKTLVSTQLPFFYDEMFGDADKIGKMIEDVIDRKDFPHVIEWDSGEFEVLFLDLMPGFNVKIMFVELAKLPEAVVQRVARIRAARGDICAIVDI